MTGQYYEEKLSIEDSVEVTIGFTVNHNKILTVDQISDLANRVAQEVYLTLKGITDQ